MDQRVQNLNINMNAFLMSSQLFKMFITLNCHVNTISPTLNFGFIGDISQDDMKLVTINDHGSLFLFIKTVPQKSKQYILKHTCYCIPKRFCDYLHYESGEIIGDNIFELYKVAPQFVNERIVFTHGNEIVDLGTIDKEEYDNIKCYIDDVEIEPRISNIMDEQLTTILGYYIRRENIEYVHCFMKEQDEYESDVDYDYLSNILDECIEDDLELDDIILKLGEYLLSTSGGTKLSNYVGIYVNSKQKTKEKFPKAQEINIHVATYFSQVLMPWFFIR